MDAVPQLIGSSPSISEVEQEIVYAARTDAKVLVSGESGVGKEVVSRLIHQRSARAGGPLVTINCSGVPDSLLESELFGHVRGSFTDAYRDRLGWFEQAHGGTIFLDEVGEMSLRMQALLLRFLENGEIQRVGSDRLSATVDVRIIAATNRNLLAQVAEKAFREDLYYRLNVIHITIPPLRERKEDVAALISHFVRVLCHHHRLNEPPINDEAMARLTAHAWPGNVRELKNVVERLVVRARGNAIKSDDLPREIARVSLSGEPSELRVKQTADRLVERMRVGGESFWSVVYEPFMAHDITREDVREVVARGLEETRGSYKALVLAFNLEPNDYKRFLSFLWKHQCHLPFQRFRSMPARVASDRVPAPKAAS